MRNPREIPEERFEKIRRNVRFGPQVQKELRGRLPNCNGKHSYRKRDAFYIKDKLLEVGKVAYLRVYHCPQCAYWHLTSKKPL